MSGIRPIKGWAVVKRNKLSVNEIYAEKDVVLAPGEKLVRVKIEVI